MRGEGWVNVRLTAFGERYLKENGGGPLRVHDRMEFVFESGKAQPATRTGDWELVLKDVAIGGHPLFEIAPEEKTTAEAPAGSAAASTRALKRHPTRTPSSICSRRTRCR